MSNPKTLRQKSHRANLGDVILNTFVCLSLAAGFCYCLTETLNEMTARDCQFGIIEACQQLEKSGISKKYMD